MEWHGEKNGTQNRNEVYPILADNVTNIVFLETEVLKMYIM